MHVIIVIHVFLQVRLENVDLADLSKEELISKYVDCTLMSDACDRFFSF